MESAVLLLSKTLYIKAGPAGMGGEMAVLSPHSKVHTLCVCGRTKATVSCNVNGLSNRENLEIWRKLALLGLLVD